MFMEPLQPGPASRLGGGGMASLSGARRTRGLTDIIPHYSTKGGGGLCGEGEVRTVAVAGGGSVRIQHLTGVSPGNNEGHIRFPKLEDCAHFHYDHVELAPLQIALCDEEALRVSETENTGKCVTVRVCSGAQSWLLRRTWENFRMLDYQLHRCIYDRKFSNLPQLADPPPEAQETVEKVLAAYVVRLSAIAGNLINCGPVLSWLELDNRGRRLLVTEGDSCPINTPAVAAAYSIKKYTAIAADEISFDIGDMISVIDMPPPEESAWWRGKRGFLVGFFPSHCVAVITDKLPQNLHLHQSLTLAGPTKPVLRKHGKLIAFFRAFILARPSRRRLKQTGILKERVFGCDLGEHLLNSGNDIPMVLKCCSKFIEQHGLVDGIYRLSGVTSNIQKLRRTFDEDRVPDLYDDEAILQDIHSVASLLKLYFRELPNPLCTYQLYDAFVQAVQADRPMEERLLLMRAAVEKLPPPHYRTLECLMRHLARVSQRGLQTGMTARNIAIVWAPNLLRCPGLEAGGVAALQGVGVQAVVTEFLILYADLIFCSTPLPASASIPTQVTPKRVRPKSLAISTPTKLLSLEEAQSRALAAIKPEQDYIEVGGGPSCLPAKYHTVLELPRKRTASKRSPLGWKNFFAPGRSSSNQSEPERKSRSQTVATTKCKATVPVDTILGPEKAITESEMASMSGQRRLRPVKSVESLTSRQNSARSSRCLEPPSPPTPAHTGPPGHNRSVSHDSYFDHLTETPYRNHAPLLPEEDEEGLSLSLDLSELQVNFDLEESEMRIFSEDETNQLFSSHASLDNQVGKRQPLLARGEDSSADPSPKKHKTGSCSSTNRSKRSRLEERLSNAELRYIDSGSPDQVQISADVHSSPQQDSHSPSLAEATVSENESLSLSGLTSPTPDTTPRPTPHYTPLTEDSLSEVTTPEYRKLTPSPSQTNYENLPRNRSSFPDNKVQPRYENMSRDRLSFQGVLKNGDLEVCQKQNDIHYENLDKEDFQIINCDITTEIMDAIMSNKVKDGKYEEMKESSIYESINDDDKINFYENLASCEDSEIYEPILGKRLTSSYEEISAQEHLLSSDHGKEGENKVNKENEYECLVMDSSQGDDRISDSNHNLPISHPKLVAKPEESIYEDVQAVPIADSQVYQQVKYLQRSVHEINQLLEDSMEPFTGEDVSSLEEEETALISPMNNGTPDSVNAVEPRSDSIAISSIGNIMSSGLDQTTSFSRRFEEAKLESSESIDTPTVQTESVTSVSISPFLETNNIVSTNESDKDLLYENSTMDDVEAISTSYEEPGRSVEMLFDNSNSKSALDSLQEDRNRSVEMIYDDSHSKSAEELLLDNQSRSIEMICEDSSSKSVQDSLLDQGRSVEMLYEEFSTKSSDSLEDQRKSGVNSFGSTNSQSIGKSLGGNGSLKLTVDQSCNSDKDTDKQIDCRLSEMDSMETPKGSLSRRLSQSLDENKRKFESEIGRDIVRERKMRQELEANSSSTTGQSSSSGRNVQELMSRFEWSGSEKESLPPCLKAKLSRQNSKDNSHTLTTSLDASSFPSADNPPLTRVKTSPDLNLNEESHGQKMTDTGVDSETVRRERIEKYKEERRTFLRKKYRTDSFNNNDDKDEEMIRRLKAKANLRSLENPEDIGAAGDSMESMEWLSQKSPLRRRESSDYSSDPSREKELENRLTEHISDKSGSKSPSRTLVSISYSPTKTKSTGWDVTVKTKSPEIERIPDRIVFSRSVSLNSNPDSLKDTKSASDKVRRRPDDLNLAGVSVMDKKEDIMSPKAAGKLDRRGWRMNDEGKSSEESLVQRRVSQLSTSVSDTSKSDTERPEGKRRTSLTDLVNSQSVVRQRANSGSAKSPSYCIRDMAALFENRDIK